MTAARMAPAAIVFILESLLGGGKSELPMRSGTPRTPRQAPDVMHAPPDQHIRIWHASPVVDARPRQGLTPPESFIAPWSIDAQRAGFRLRPTGAIEDTPNEVDGQSAFDCMTRQLAPMPRSSKQMWSSPSPGRSRLTWHGPRSPTRLWRKERGRRGPARMPKPAGFLVPKSGRTATGCPRTARCRAGRRRRRS